MNSSPPDGKLRFPIPHVKAAHEAGIAGEGQTQAIDLHIRRQPSHEQPAEWLEEIRSFRARVLYDNGRRPGFKSADTTYVDAQHLDLGSFHLVAYLEQGAGISAYIRLSPPELSPHFQARRHLGDQKYADMLTAMGVPASSVFEAGRLVTALGLHGRGLGSWMVTAVIAAGRALGASLMLATSGTGDGQHLFLGRLGWQARPDTDGFSSHYQDTVRVLTHRVSEGARGFEPVAAELHRRITPLSNDGVTRIRSPFS